MSKYFMVHTPGTMTKVEHPTYEAACAEASRLASINPGKEFNIMEICNTKYVELTKHFCGYCGNEATLTTVSSSWRCTNYLCNAQGPANDRDGKKFDMVIGVPRVKQNIFPKYYVNPTGFFDDMMYVRCDGPTGDCVKVFQDGSEQKFDGLDYQKCLYHSGKTDPIPGFTTGFWIEVPFEEANKLIRKSDWPKYFIKGDEKPWIDGSLYVEFLNESNGYAVSIKGTKNSISDGSYLRAVKMVSDKYNPWKQVSWAKINEMIKIYGKK